MTSSYNNGAGDQTIVTTIRSDRYLVTVVQQISQFGDSTVAEAERVRTSVRILD